VKPPRLYLDSCVLVEGLVAPWSASRGLLILGRAASVRFVVAEAGIEETERVLTTRLGEKYGSPARLGEDFRFLLERLQVERVEHVSAAEFEQARRWIRHWAGAPVLAAAVKARPDWLITDNTAHFDAQVERRTGLRIATPEEFLERAGSVLE